MAWTVLFALFVPWVADARVFNLKNETLSSYFRTSFSDPELRKKPFENSSGAATTSFDNGFTTLVGYELGVAWKFSRIVTRLGLEIVRPNSLSVRGFGTTGELFEMTAETSIFIPKLALEFGLYEWSQGRWFIMGEGGLATLSMQNSYNFTAAGTAQYGLSNYREEVRGIGASIVGALGLEATMTDTSTFVLEVGYRSLEFTSLFHQVSGTTIAQGAVSGGTPAKENGSGAERSLSLSAPYVAASFRFWFW